MTLEAAQQEFELREVRWHISEFEKEIRAGFPILRQFKSGNEWTLYRCMQQLKRKDQMALVQGQCKTWHKSSPQVMRELGEITPKEKKLWEWFYGSVGEWSDIELELRKGKRARAKFKFASKPTLRKAMVAKFVEAYGSRCTRMEIGAAWDPQFHIPCCGWIIGTQLYFGRKQPIISLEHWIEGPNRPRRNAVNPTKLCLGTTWLGLRELTHVLDDEVEAACDTSLQISRNFLEAAPKLMKGLEFEEVSDAGITGATAA